MKKKTKNSLKTMLAILIILISIIVICNVWINIYASKRTYSDTSSIPKRHVGLLLGTSPILSSGRPNLYFSYRIKAAAELYKAGKINYILVSGDNRKKEYNEPEEMKNALIKAGIPEEKIYLDYAGFRTLDSVVRAKEIFEQKSFTIISQRFHNERAIFLAHRYGINAIGYNAQDVNKRNGIKTKTREVFARVKVFVDFITNKKPKFLGEKIEIKLD